MEASSQTGPTDATSASAPSPKAKRKRGRPPKKRTAEQLVASEPSANRRRRKHSKRYQWSNALHVRFLLAMCDWAIENADASRLLPFMGEMANALMTPDEVMHHLKDYAERSKVTRSQIVAACDRQVAEDYAKGRYKPPLRKDNEAATSCQLCFTSWPVPCKPMPKLPPKQQLQSSQSDASKSAPAEKKKRGRKQTISHKRTKRKTTKTKKAAGAKACTAQSSHAIVAEHVSVGRGIPVAHVYRSH